ncbi:COP9 signalosome complex subunit 11 [Wickerhamomyces ciferrii]|uniref:COP9 signalosome complex subunit 11 n=1 Tax=Wickerhamomyces ciferrii (strain ATCC 14091 / BCRC 22168 / CBS 111 / JCM 3599 / NBRC 0793 / NRRL Y-1031 F-60-10) TaxID=1206466 RepID=K0KSG9_WICCF|nr:COP9 signalosome complex subunit 11 [Wickerhamomyces ciferrii]CCH44264.1 COP9 signalosome complex subunit 11 [Wickerhamomyces ciferrii]
MVRTPAEVGFELITTTKIEELLNTLLAKLKEIRERYNGELEYMKSSDPQVVGIAALSALEYLDENDQASPYIEQLIKRLEAIPQSERTAKFLNPQWNISIQNNKSKKLRSVGNENLYHETDIERTIEIAELYAYNKLYSEAANVLLTSAMGSPTCQLAEYSAKVGILQAQYQNVFNQDKRVEAFLTLSLSNELYLKRLTEQEVISYWRVKYLILFAYFLKKDFKEVTEQIFKLITAPSIQTASGKNISALQILKDSNFGNFIHRDEIEFASFLSILAHKSPKELADIVNDEHFIALIGTKVSETRPYFLALNSAQFKQLNLLLDNLEGKTKSNVFFRKVWPVLRLRMRERGYNLYLNLSSKISADHLSKRLNIPKEQVISEIQDHVKKLRLEVVYDPETEIFEAKKTDRRFELASKLQKLSEDCDTVEANLREKLDLTQQKAERAGKSIDR